MVGQWPLKPLIGVRIPVPEPNEQSEIGSKLQIMLRLNGAT